MPDTFYSKIRLAINSQGILYVKTVKMCIQKGIVKPPAGYSIQEAMGVIDAAILDFQHDKLKRDAKR